MRRDEAGVVTLWGVAMIGLLALVAVVAFALVGVVAGHRRAQAAADLAALAGAQALRDGGDACASAARLAARNDGELPRCGVDQWSVEVAVLVRVPGLFGREHVLRGRAVAGPGPAESWP